MIEELKQLYRNARAAGKEGKGTHRAAGSSGRVHALFIEAARSARLSGLDVDAAMAEVRAEK